MTNAHALNSRNQRRSGMQRKIMKHCNHREPDHKYVDTTYDKWGDEIPPHWDYGEKDALVKYDKTHDQCRLCKQLVRNDR